MPSHRPDNFVHRAAAQIATIRRADGHHSLCRFVDFYLRDHFSRPHSPMHLEFLDLLSSGIQKRAARIAAAIPNGYGKSTMASFALPIWAVSYGHARHIVLLSATRQEAGEHLANIAREISRNQRLRRDFPHLCQASSTGFSKAGGMRELFVGMAARLIAVGRSASVRGLRFGPRRPDLIVVDQLERRDEDFAPRRLALTASLFHKSILRAGTEQTSVVVIGTRRHSRSLLATLLEPSKSPDWSGHTYAAITTYSARPDLWCQWELVHRGQDLYEGATGPEAAARMLVANRARMLEGTEVLWPKHETYAALMEQKVRDGWCEFDAEKQNTPVPDRLDDLKIKTQLHLVFDDSTPTPPPSPPYEWKDDARIIRRSYDPDPRTASLRPTPPEPEVVVLELD